MEAGMEVHLVPNPVIQTEMVRVWMTGLPLGVQRQVGMTAPLDGGMGVPTLTRHVVRKAVPSRRAVPSGHRDTSAHAATAPASRRGLRGVSH